MGRIRAASDSAKRKADGALERKWRSSESVARRAFQSRSRTERGDRLHGDPLQRHTQKRVESTHSANRVYRSSSFSSFFLFEFYKCNSNQKDFHSKHSFIVSLYFQSLQSLRRKRSIRRRQWKENLSGSRCAARVQKRIRLQNSNWSIRTSRRSGSLSRGFPVCSFTVFTRRWYFVNFLQPRLSFTFNNQN